MAKTRSASKNPLSAARSQRRVSAEERQRMIAEAAYFRALARGFAGGDALDDWLAAEQQIDGALNPSPPHRQKQATPASIH